MEAHARLCIAARDARLAVEDKKWADTELLRLAERFCISKVDTEVMWSALSSCKTQNEMQAEATTWLADNQVVKNFAAKLWSKQQPRRGPAG